ARALRKEDETDMRGAAIDGRAHRFLALQATDFHVPFHGCDVAWFRSGVEPKDGGQGLTLRPQSGAPYECDTPKEVFMRLILAIILPFVVFFTIGRPIAGIICLILQITLIGCWPAAIWAVYALSQYKTDQKSRDA